MIDKPIFKSKRFISAVVGVVVMVLVAYLPELAPFETIILENVADVVVALIAGYSLTDIARDWLANR